MNTSDMKNIVVLKNLPSNIVEEAIVILKENVNFKEINKKKENVKVAAFGKTDAKDYVVKEAENVVANYILKLEKPKQLEITNKKLKKKYDRIKSLTVLLGIVATFGIVVNLI